ncbi:polycystic kidney disease protein 1-like 3 [Caerostris darwini]|uniref:Polycystic kidney disease protein 1-like 3 n=1 Tax=Caerostris darwini TaxID=1538125 RepID=A0AAV4N0R9_9ARAC|nr:polycystic kidney disease protein 1-like 3 [Caerostris darwini]
MHCMEWKSDHQPLYYELRYSLIQEEPGHMIYFGLNRNVKFVLPAGFATKSFNVYLNVIIRNNLGASTKVCSLVREVKPLSLNVTLIQYIYNETFHPQSQLAKYLEEKQNQALLHQIHILSTSLNNFGLIKTSSSKEKILKEQIRFRFLEAIENLKILNRVEAVQALSCLSEIITDISEITMFELQKIYNIYDRLHNHKSEMHGFTSEVLQHEFLVLLSKLVFASHSVYLRNEELIRMGRQQFVEEIKSMMKTRLKVEEPLIVEVPHAYICALYLLNFEQNPFQLPLKSTEIIFEGFNSTFKRERIRKSLSNKYNAHENCIAMISQEFDYVSMPHYLNFAQVLSSTKTSVLFSILSCDKLERIENEIDMNFTIRFSRNLENQIDNNAFLTAHNMNFHQINITEDDINHSYLFHVKIENMMNTSEQNFQIEALFRHKTWPTPKKYAWRQSFPLNAKERSFFITENYIKDPGLYYFALWTPIENKNIMSNEVIGEYSIFIWKDVCLGKSRGIWSTQNCHSSETSNYFWTDCKCSAQEITAYSIPFLSHIFFDKLKNVNNCPIPLIDNSNNHKQLYVICVKTGIYFSSGTTASVFIVLHGTKGMTETRQLIDSKAEKFCFQKGSVDLFLMSTEKSLGPLVKLEIWHNNYGLSPSWYLKSVTIKDLKTGHSYDFECSKWLSAEKGDGQIERELTVSETVPSFISVFSDSFITFIHDLNMWNSVICESPSSFYTGVQRLTCCLCFCLNCAFLIILLMELILEKDINHYDLPHISKNTFPICLFVSAVATIPQVVFTFLFRYSKLPQLNIDPKFSQILCFLSLQHLYCWLQHKRSNSSRSSDRSASSLGESDSFYSSFEESSVMSIPELMAESFSTEGKDEFPTSVSSVSINDPVSPLQKTLSTWQAFENWVRKKHDLIKSDPSGRQVATEKSDSVLIPEEIMLEDLENLNEMDSNSIASNDSQQEELKEDYVYNTHTMVDNLNLCLHFPFLHYSFYYIAWVLLASNILLIGTFTVMKISSFSSSKCTFWIKYIFFSLLCSFLLIIPFMVLMLAVLSSLKRYLGKEIPPTNNSPMQEIVNNETDKIQPSYKRIEYFKKYLRPPREQVLEQFRQCAFKEKFIFNLQSYFWQYIAMLILLLVLSLPNETYNRYMQRTSILNTFFKENMLTLKISLNSSLELIDWFEYDFVDRFYGRNQCLDPSFDCGITLLTGCSVVGSAVIRLFKTSPYADHSFAFWETDYTSKNASSYNLLHKYEPRLLKGYYGNYYKEDDFVILSDNLEEAEEQMDAFLPVLLNTTSGAVSVEFLLFNPSFSTLTSVSFLFEITELQVHFTKELLPAKLHEPKTFLRSILIRSKSHKQRAQCEKVTFKDTRKVLQKKLTGYFQSLSPQIVAKDDYVLPVDFLLIELEQLAETLLNKTNNLFIENEISKSKKLEDTISSSAIEGYLNSQYQLLEKEIGLEFPIPEEMRLNCAFDSTKLTEESQGNLQDLITERLTATMPRLNKSAANNVQPSSLNASLVSQRKFKHFTGKNLNLSSSLPHKIRKTYPLYHVDSDSSSSSSESILDKNVGISLRKTKSRGKGKNNELNLNVLDDFSF